MNDIIRALSIGIIPLLLAITLHEAAHGYVAKHFGDKTAWMMGRVTLNPLKHIDPIGTVLMPIALLALSGGAFAFGYAKPVPVNFGNLRNPKRDMIWVAAAGPASNFVQALLWGCAFLLLLKVGLDGAAGEFFIAMCKAGVWLNVILFVFNLLPLPPLDGGRILSGLLPYQYASMLGRIEPYGFFIVVFLLLTKVLENFWLLPIGSLTMRLIDLLLTPIKLLLGLQ